MDLVITSFPERKGKWLAVQEGSSLWSIAKFRDDEALARFEEWARQSNGKIFHFTSEED